MYTDYAKRPSFKQSPQRSLAAIVIIVSAVAIAALLILLFLQQHQQQEITPAENIVIKPTEEKPPKYDFYTQLTNNHSRKAK